MFDTEKDTPLKWKLIPLKNSFFLKNRDFPLSLYPFPLCGSRKNHYLCIEFRKECCSSRAQKYRRYKNINNLTDKWI